MNEYIIGTLDLDSPRNIFLRESEGKENFKGSAGVCNIKVKGNEGIIPHFHIEGKNGFECCVCIFEPKYFTHKTSESKLDKDQREILNSFMKENKSKDNKGVTHWQNCAQTWLDQNVDTEQKKEAFIGYCKKNNIYIKGYNEPNNGKSYTSQPNYNNMKESIH